MKASWFRSGVSALLLSLSACGAASGDGEATGTSEATDAASSTSSTTGEAGETGTETTGDGDGDGDGDAACNGWVELCERAYDEVAFPGTHNANAAKVYGYGLFNANQNFGLTRQLEDGVRVMMLDVTYDGDETVLCHGPCNLGSTPHAEGLAEIKAFMEANPREVLTIIYQDSISTEDMQADWAAAGLESMAFTHAVGDPWPTLGEMIDAGTRIVVTAEAGRPPPDWYHHVWDLAWDTGYSWYGLDDMNCELNRGSLDNELFLVNHWISSQLDLPDEGQAGTANAYDALVGRLETCQAERGHIPNFVAVDFYDEGDLFDAVAHINGLL